MSRPAELDQAAVAAIVAHLNADHAHHMLDVCRTLGDLPGAVMATVTSVDLDGLELEACCDGHPRSVRVAWLGPVRTRADVRTEVVRLHQVAESLLGGRTAPERGG